MENLQAYITLGVLVISMFFYITAIIPPVAVALLSSASLVLMGVIDAATFAGGFSNDVAIFIIFGSIVAGAMETTGSISLIGKWITDHVHLEERKMLIFLMAAAAILSAFLNNVTIAVVFISIINSLAGSGKYKRKNMYMGVCLASLLGGCLTLVGSSIQLGINAVLPSYGVQQMKMFDLTLVFAPAAVMMLLYYYFYAYKHGLKAYDFEEIEAVENEQNIQQASEKSLLTWLPAVGMVIMIASMVCGMDYPVVSAAVAMLLISVKCIAPKQAWKAVDWTTVFVCAGSIGLANAMKASGAATLVANFFIGLLGTETSPHIYLIIFVLLACIMTNVMLNLATALVLLPIAIPIAQGLGVNPFPFVIAITCGVNCAFVTPIGASVMTLGMQCGYRFKDYTTTNLLFSILCIVLLVVWVPVVFPF